MMSRLKTCYQKRLALKISHIIKLVPVLWLAGCALTPVPPATGNWSVELGRTGFATPSETFKYASNL